MTNEEYGFDWIDMWLYKTRDGREVRCVHSCDNGKACMWDTVSDSTWMVRGNGSPIRASDDCEIVDGPECPPEEMEEMERDIKEGEELQKAVNEEREQWDYGHHEGILDALESLLSFRDNMNPDVLLAVIHKIARRKLFDPPF